MNESIKDLQAELLDSAVDENDRIAAAYYLASDYGKEGMDALFEALANHPKGSDNWLAIQLLRLVVQIDDPRVPAMLLAYYKIPSEQGQVEYEAAQSLAKLKHEHVYPIIERYLFNPPDKYERSRGLNSQKLLRIRAYYPC